jgi:hypothetical protein
MRSLFAFVVILTISLTGVAQGSRKTVATPFGPQSSPTPIPPQTPAPGPPAFYPDSPTRVFAIKYVDSRAIQKLLEPFGVPVALEPRLSAIAVKAPEKTLDAIEEVIKRFDIPANTPKRIEITAYLVLGSVQTEPDSIPATLKPVIDQLRNVMAYKSYRVLDTILATGKEGDQMSEFGSTAKLSDADATSPQYSFFAIPRTVTGQGAEQSVHLDDLRLELNLKDRGVTGRIGTSVDVKKNQQVVIGKTTLQDRAMFLILSAKILD